VGFLFRVPKLKGSSETILCEKGAEGISRRAMRSKGSGRGRGSNATREGRALCGQETGSNDEVVVRPETKARHSTASRPG